jgi:hypothetical protein
MARRVAHPAPGWDAAGAAVCEFVQEPGEPGRGLSLRPAPLCWHVDADILMHREPLRMDIPPALRFQLRSLGIYRRLTKRLILGTAHICVGTSRE